MLKEFIEHIQKTTQPLITNVNGSAFCVTSDGSVELEEHVWNQCSTGCNRCGTRATTSFLDGCGTVEQKIQHI